MKILSGFSKAISSLVIVVYAGELISAPVPINLSVKVAPIAQMSGDQISAYLSDPSQVLALSREAQVTLLNSLISKLADIPMTAEELSYADSDIQSHLAILNSTPINLNLDQIASVRTSFQKASAKIGFLKETGIALPPQSAELFQGCSNNQTLKILDWIAFILLCIFSFGTSCIVGVVFRCVDLALKLPNGGGGGGMVD